MSSPALTRCPTSATQTTRPAMTLATRASERLTIEPGIQLFADTERVVTVPTCTGTGGPAAGSAACALRAATKHSDDANKTLTARGGIAVTRAIAAGSAAAAGAAEVGATVVGVTTAAVTARLVARAALL